MTKRRKRITRTSYSRATFVLLAFLALALIIAVRLVILQVINHEYYKRAVMDEITVETEVNPERGVIYDRGGNILATNKTVYLCFISPQDIIDGSEKAAADARELAEKKAEALEKGDDWDESKEEAAKWKDSKGSTHTLSQMDDLIASFLAETLGEKYGVEYILLSGYERNIQIWDNEARQIRYVITDEAALAENFDCVFEAANGTRIFMVGEKTDD